MEQLLQQAYAHVGNGLWRGAGQHGQFRRNEAQADEQTDVLLLGRERGSGIETGQEVGCLLAQQLLQLCPVVVSLRGPPGDCTPDRGRGSFIGPNYYSL